MLKMPEPELLKSEEDFHDHWAEQINLDEVLVDEFFEASTCPENRHIISQLPPLKGKRTLELGCGAGEASVYMAKQGADAVAGDLSEGMLEVALALAKRHQVSIETLKSSAHSIPVGDERFDIVYAANLLHHVDVERTLKESHRVLKPDGIFVSWDPLAHNPVINVYRMMATKVRTKNEHPLTMKDLELFEKIFSKVEFKMTWFLSLWIFLKFFLVDRIHPNSERYWKRIVTRHKEIGPLYKRLERADTRLLKTLPFLRRYCWNVVVVAKK